MKKNLFFITCFFLGLFSYKSYAQKYDETDKEGLRIYLRQLSSEDKKLNLEILGLEIKDTLSWSNSEEWVDKLVKYAYQKHSINFQFSDIDYSNKKRLVEISFPYTFPPKYPNLLFPQYSKVPISGNLDCSNFEELVSVSISNTNIETIDVTNNRKLVTLNFIYGNLTNLDVSKNQNLVSLDITGNNITDIDLLSNKKLTYFVAYGNNIKKLELKNTNISLLICTSENLENLSVPNSLIYLYLVNTKLKEIDLSNTNINYLYILSTNPQLKNIIVSKRPYEYISYWNGKLTLKQAITGNLLLKTSINDLHQINTGEPFKVNILVNTDVEEIKIGLFSTDGITLIEDITQNKKDNTYTCLISQNVNQGNYIIQPYKETSSSKIIILERESGSFIIDKLPIYVTGNDIWSRTIVSEELTISSHLQLKASQPNKYEIEKETNFMVYALQPSPDTRIGLFTTNGVLVEDIVISRKNNTFNCMISQYVPEAKYIIAPYEKTEGKIKIIERISGNSIIDKLPLTVTEGDIWSFKTIQETESNTDLVIYPNPVIDILKVQTNEPVENIELYTLEGLLVKSITFQSQLNIQDLSSGIYIVKIKSGSKVKTTKIFKK